MHLLLSLKLAQSSVSLFVAGVRKCQSGRDVRASTDEAAEAEVLAVTEGAEWKFA